MTSQLRDWQAYVLAGNAKFTVENTATGGRFTYHVCKSNKWANTWYVSVLVGPDNTRDYLYIGSITGLTFQRTPKSKIREDAASFVAFKWFNDCVNGMRDLPEQVKVYHVGYCGRCGRQLTVPESIEWGFGPECVLHVFEEVPHCHFDLETGKKARKLMQLQAQLRKEQEASEHDPD